MSYDMNKPDRLSSLMGRIRLRVRIPNETAEISYKCDQKNNACLTLATFGHLTKQFVSNAGIDAKGVEENDHFLVFCRSTDGSIPKSVAGNFTLDAANALVFLDGLELIASAMPSIMAVNLKQAVELGAICTTISREIHTHRCGFEVIVERLCEIVLIRLLRMTIEREETKAGMLAGLGHSNICLALIAMHEHPEKKWKIEDLALKSGMSRTAFANKFKEVVGETPGTYLKIWRLTLAKIELQRGVPLKAVARNVGYASQSSLSRAYKEYFGATPGKDK